MNGLGFAAVRDWNAWLRSATKDDLKQSQSAGGRHPADLHRDRLPARTNAERLRNLGFNQAENGKKVFDGMMQWISAGDGINMNYRFSQPDRTERNRQDHLYVEGVFPFANVPTTDPLTGKTDSRYDGAR